MENNIIFRNAVKSDIDELVSLYRSVVKNMNDNGIFQWDETYPNRDVVEEDISKNQLYVGTIDGIIATAYTINDVPDDLKNIAKWKNPDISHRNIHRICVNPEFRGQKIAEKAMKHIEEQMLNENIHALRLDTVSQNVPAVSLYKKLGYTIVGTDTWQDGFVYYFEKYI
jgi:ribosomal protein S18 acetylase RimI-like enzyme